MKSKLAILLILLTVCLGAFAQTPSVSTPTIEARAEALLRQLSLEEKIDLIGGLDNFYIRDIWHIGLPRLKMADGPAGVRNYGPATTFGGIGLAATWDSQLAERVGAIIGQDARARGVHFVLGPGVNIYRAATCGRNFEYFGEDPFLASRTAVAYIRGMQSEGVSATIKHFVGNDQEYDRHNGDSLIDERTLREIYLPTFEAAVKEAQVGAIMDSYNLTNGLHMTQNPDLNIDVAKKEWGFDGIMMSDWDATYDGVAAANGGLDLEMPSGKFMNRATLLPAVKSGQVSEGTIDDKVRRILRTAIRFGWLDREQTDLSIPLLNQKGAKVALEAARSSMVLLKNDNLLPFDQSKIKSIAVIGPDAYPAQAVGGGSARLRPFTAISFLEGISKYLGDKANVYSDEGILSLAEMADATNFSIDEGGTQPGLRAEIFDNPNLSGVPSLRRTDGHVNFHILDDGAKDDHVSARWTGYFTPRAAGDHLIFTQDNGEEGGSRLYVDDKPVIDNWNHAYARVGQVHMNLSSGAHKIRFEYFSNGNWSGPNVKLGIIRPETAVTAAAKTIASHADAVVVAVGFDPSSESEDSDRTFQLPPAQDELIQQLSAVNKNIVVVVTSGGAVDMTPWLDSVPALFEAWYPGQEGGTALAQLLFGEYSPSGKLPVSFERRWQDNAIHDNYYPRGTGQRIVYAEGVFLGYRYFDKEKMKPAFPFGFGLSYTTFAYKNLTVTPARASGDQSVTVSFDITNSGLRPGAEVAEVYVGEIHPAIPRPLKELKGFAKIQLEPGETRHVSVPLNRRAFAYYNVKNHDWTVDAGDFNIYVGGSSAHTELTGNTTRLSP